MLFCYEPLASLVVFNAPAPARILVVALNEARIFTPLELEHAQLKIGTPSAREAEVGQYVSWLLALDLLVVLIAIFWWQRLALQHALRRRRAPESRLREPRVV
jgi:hypothetical protein